MYRYICTDTHTHILYRIYYVTTVHSDGRVLLPQKNHEFLKTNAMNDFNL